MSVRMGKCGICKNDKIELEEHKLKALKKLK